MFTASCILAKRLLIDKHEIIGIDNLNDYYDVTLKQNRLSALVELTQSTEVDDGFVFEQMDLADRSAINKLFANNQFDVVINGGAMAGATLALGLDY